MKTKAASRSRLAAKESWRDYSKEAPVAYTRRRHERSGRHAFRWASVTGAEIVVDGGMTVRCD
jgi:hypothetical protein